MFALNRYLVSKLSYSFLFACKITQKSSFVQRFVIKTRCFAFNSYQFLININSNLRLID